MSRLQLKTWQWLALILVLALGLRLITLGGRTLWYDEVFAVLFAETGWDAMIDGTLTEVDGRAAEEHPLAYYVLLDSWMDVFGQNPAAVRLLNVILGVLTVLAVYWLARDWFGEQAALAAALSVAVAPFHVQYSQEARMYALLALLLVLATWVYWRAYNGGQIGYWLGFGLLAGASMYTQQLAAMYLIALGTLPLLARDWRRQVYTGLAALLAVIVYLPWLVNLPEQMNKLKQYWIAKPHILQMWLALRSFVSVNLDFAPAWWLPTFLLAALLVVLLLWRGIAVQRSAGSTRAQRKMQYTDTERLAIRWALWLAFMPMIVMWIVSQILQPVYLTRALVPSAVVFYVALAWLFVRAGMPRLITGGLVLSCGVIVMFGLITLYTWDTFPNGRFDDAVDFLAEQQQSDDVIVHGNKITMFSMVYYARVHDRTLDQHFVRDIPGSGSDTLARPTQITLNLLADDCAAIAAGGADRVWYVSFQRFDEEMVELVTDDPGNQQYDSLGWLRAHYTEAAHERFNDLNVYLFTDPDASALAAQCPVVQ